MTIKEREIGRINKLLIKEDYLFTKHWTIKDGKIVKLGLRLGIHKGEPQIIAGFFGKKGKLISEEPYSSDLILSKTKKGLIERLFNLEVDKMLNEP
jgi:hypothetical protein